MMDQEQQNNQPISDEPVVIKPSDPGILNIAHEAQPNQENTAQEPEQSATEPTAPEEQPQETNQEPDSKPELQTTTNQNQDNQWQYQSGQLEPNYQDQTPQQTQESFSWTASESVSHEKTGSWYMALVVIVIALAAVIYFITKDIFSVIVVVIVAVALGVFAGLKPKNINYSIGPTGISVGQKQFDFNQFKSFAVIDQGSAPSVLLLPQKRFMISLPMYFLPQDAEKITNLLGEFLPYEHKEPDLIDRFSTKIHF